MDTDWTLGPCIGKGSFGTVSLAYPKSDGARPQRPFAVKSAPVSSPPSVDSLNNEIEILRSLSSDHVVSYIGHSTTDDHHRQWRHLHMEYIPGGTLADVAGTLDDLQVRQYTRSVLLALSYLHSVAGVVHSDVKGRNVLVGPSPGLAKLADFGSARRIFSGTRLGSVSGTPLWMAPEVARGETPTPESDIWSLGCTVIEMVTGHSPWWKKMNMYDDGQFLLRIAFGEELPEFLSNWSKLGEDFLEKCLRRDGRKRWSAEELLRHPYIADVESAKTGMSPRSTLDWFSSDFDEDEEDEEEEKEMVVLGRERIRELGENCGVVDWGSNGGWKVVRCLEEQREGENREGTCWEIEDCCRDELGDSQEISTHQLSTLNYETERNNIVSTFISSRFQCSAFETLNNFVKIWNYNELSNTSFSSWSGRCSSDCKDQQVQRVGKGSWCFDCRLLLFHRVITVGIIVNQVFSILVLHVNKVHKFY